MDDSLLLYLQGKRQNRFHRLPCEHLFHAYKTLFEYSWNTAKAKYPNLKMTRRTFDNVVMPDVSLRYVVDLVVPGLRNEMELEILRLRELYRGHREAFLSGEIEEPEPNEPFSIKLFVFVQQGERYLPGRTRNYATCLSPTFFQDLYIDLNLCDPPKFITLMED